MHLLKQLIKSLLVESKLDDLKKQFSTIDVETVARNDPSGSKLKYAQWMLKQLKTGASPEDLYPTVAFFDKNIAKFKSADINSYKTLKQLEDEAKSIAEQQPSKQQQKLAAKSEAQKIYEDDDFIVIHPDSKRSCMVYGSNTKWCITMSDANYYEQYTSANVVFYFILSKKKESNDPSSKIAAAVMRDARNKVNKIEWYNAKDKKLSIAKAILLLNPLGKEVVKLIKADAAKRPMGFFAKLNNNVATDDEIMTALNDSINDEYGVEVRKAIASSASAPLEAFNYLANDKNVHVRLYVAGNTKTSSDTLIQLANDKESLVRLYVALNKNTPQDTLMQLANDEEAQVRSYVAINPSTSSNTLMQLANDKEAQVRRSIAGNPKTPSDTLMQLANNEEALVRLYVAKNPKTPQDTLMLLANDENKDVRWHITANPNVPIETLMQLANDENKDVRSSAQTILNTSKVENVVLLKRFINETINAIN